MKQLIIIAVIIAICGAGAGIGIGVLITKSKVDERNTIIAELELKMQELENANKASQEKTRYADARADRLSREIAQLRTELEKAKAAAAQEPVKTTAEETKEQPVAIDNTQKTDTIVYTVKEGDSLWKIAETQLGNGSRYQEIEKLNPDLKSNKNLLVGTKLNLPAK